MLTIKISLGTNTTVLWNNIRVEKLRLLGGSIEDGVVRDSRRLYDTTEGHLIHTGYPNGRAVLVAGFILPIKTKGSAIAG